VELRGLDAVRHVPKRSRASSTSHLEITILRNGSRHTASIAGSSWPGEVS
jgi:hypothetical protein